MRAERDGWALKMRVVENGVRGESWLFRRLGDRSALVMSTRQDARDLAPVAREFWSFPHTRVFATPVRVRVITEVVG